MEVYEAKRLKELGRENTELKKMLAETLLKNRVLEFMCEKSCEPGGRWRGRPFGEYVFRASGLSVSEVVEVDVEVSASRGLRKGAALERTIGRTLGQASAVRLSPNRGAASGRLGGG